jgi:hypothetical protein
MPGRRFRQPGGEPPSGSEQVQPSAPTPAPPQAPAQAEAPPQPPVPGEVPADVEAPEAVEEQTVPVEEWLPHQRSDWVEWWEHDPAKPEEVPDDVMEKLRAEADEKYAKYPKDKGGELPPDVREAFEAEKAAYGQREAPGQPASTEQPPPPPPKPQQQQQPSPPPPKPPPIR